MPRPEITPAPPLAEGIGLPWDVPVTDAVAQIGRARAAYGDTFEVRSGRDRYLFTFSATGVESFYALPEDVASKGIADYLMLRRKLPDEIFDGRRTLPGTLFRRDDVANYLANLDLALATTAAELGDSGTVEVFALTRRLAHRMGLASWAGPGSASGEAFERLISALDALDGAEAFVHPDAMAAVAASGKAAELAALAEVRDVVGDALDRLDAGETDGHGLFARIATLWAGEPAGIRRTGIAYDVALIHVASMSNLAAALGWLVVDLLANPAVLAEVLAGDQDLTERCALESTRIAQRSIMSRAVMTEVVFDDGNTSYVVPPGTTIATLLPLLNTTAATGLTTWDPSRWNRWKLADTSGLASPQLVTAFGHGRHSCPAQPFSLAAMTAAATGLLGTFAFEPRWSSYPAPVPAQIGGVARAAEACEAAYRRR